MGFDAMIHLFVEVPLEAFWHRSLKEKRILKEKWSSSHIGFTCLEIGIHVLPVAKRLAFWALIAAGFGCVDSRSSSHFCQSSFVRSAEWFSTFWTALSTNLVLKCLENGALAASTTRLLLRRIWLEVQCCERTATVVCLLDTLAAIICANSIDPIHAKDLQCQMFTAFVCWLELRCVYFVFAVAILMFSLCRWMFWFDMGLVRCFAFRFG